VTVRESKEGGSGERERDYITMKEEAREDWVPGELHQSSNDLPLGPTFLGSYHLSMLPLMLGTKFPVWALSGSHSHHIQIVAHIREWQEQVLGNIIIIFTSSYHIF
jgi:hypothetical protein